MQLNKGLSIAIRILKIPTRILSIIFLTRVYLPEDFATLTEVTLYSSLLSLPIIMGRDTQLLRGTLSLEDVGIFDILLIALIGLIILIVSAKIGMIVFSAALLSINAIFDAYYRFHNRVNQMLILDYVIMVLSTLLIPLIMKSSEFLIIGYFLYLGTRIIISNKRYKLLWFTLPKKFALNLRIANGSLVNSLSLKIDNIYSQLFLSPGGFVLYVRSYSLFNIPIDLYGKYLNDYELKEISKNIKTVSKIYWHFGISIVIAIAIYFNLNLFVNILFSEKWLSIVSSMEVLVFIIPLRVLQKYFGIMLLGESRDTLFLKIQIYNLLIISIFLAGLKVSNYNLDYITVSWAVLGANICNSALLIFHFLMYKRHEIF